MTVDGCVLPVGADTPAGSTEPVNNDAGRTTLDGRSAAGVEEKGA